MTLIKNPFKLLGVANFFRNLHFTFPVLILIYTDKGVSIGDYFLIQGLYLWAILFMEIPSGYFGDLFSRRKNLAFAALICAAGCLVWLFGYGFWALLIGELLFGFGDAFSSGTDDAYTYDLTKQYKKTNHFHNILAKQSSLQRGGFFVAACSGAFIYQFFGVNGVILAVLASYLVAMGLFLILPEAKAEKRVVENKTHIRDIFGICHTSLKNPSLRLMMMVYAVVASNMAIFHWGLQPFMLEENIPVYMYSIVTGAALLAWTVWSGVAGKVLDKVQFAGTAWVSFGLFVASYLLMFYISSAQNTNFTYLLLPLIAFMSGNRELVAVSSSTLMNHRIKSNERSTIMSVRGMLSSLIRGAILIAIKPLSEIIGMGNVFAISSILLIPVLWLCIKASRMKLSISGK